MPVVNISMPSTERQRQWQWQWQWQRPRRFSVLCIFVSQLDPMQPPAGSVRLSKDVEIGNISASMPVIKYVLLKLIHSCRCWIDPRGAAMIPIHLFLFQKHGTRLSVHSPIKLCAELNLVSERRFMVPKLLLSSKTRSRGVSTATDIIKVYLSSMHIPEKMHPYILQEIYDEAQVADPALPIDVTMVSVHVCVLGKPPTKSSSSFVVAGLENVRLDCLESCIRQEPCAICQESLDHIYDAQEGFTRLPCLHIFHRDCLVQCLEMSPECPVCKYPLPQVGEPSGRLHWPMLLIMSAAGILTARLLYRLLKPA